MKKPKQISVYQSPLREEQKEQTRQRIIDAAVKLMGEKGLQDFSFSAIAKAAGVQERTVYRHFPNKTELLNGIWLWYQANSRYGAIPSTEQELLSQPLRTFAAFDEMEQLSRAVWSTPEGREFRLSNIEERKAGIKASVADATRGLPARQAEWLTAVIHVVNSGTAWQTMKDYWGFSGEDAGKAAAFVTELLLNAARQNIPPVTKRKKKE